MDILFAQPRFPGQYRHIMRALAIRGGHRMVFLHDVAMAGDPPFPGVELVPYGPVPASVGVHPFALDLDQAARRGEAVARAARGLKERGFSPAVVAAFFGYGESLFLREVFPQARHVTFAEYHYRPDAPTLGFDPEDGPVPLETRMAARMRGAVAHLALENYRTLLQVSAAHVYLSYPFVLSWSALEAMACGCALVASRTPPVEEVMREGENARLVDFFDAPALAARLAEALVDRRIGTPLRAGARRTIQEGYELSDCLRRQTALIGALAAGAPPPVA